MSKAQRDLYEVLGIARGATADEIKKAYRAKARTLHPDVNKAPGAGEQFAEVQRAYDILSDEEQRRKYDRFGHTNNPDMFSSAAASIDPDDLGSMFDAFFGARGAPGRAGPARRGRDLQRVVEIAFMTAVRGGTEPVRIETDRGARTIEVKVPPGVQGGAKLRVRGGGGQGVGEGESGDLIVTVQIGKHPLYRRVERSALDLEMTLPLSVAEATLGASIELPSPDGRKVNLRVPEGTQSGTTLRVRGHGIRSRTGEQGDLLAVAEVVIPDPALLNEQERAILGGLTAKTPRMNRRFPA